MRARLAALLALVATAVAGCLQIGTDTGDASSETTGATTDAGGGTSCGLDPTGTITLCEEIDECPGLGVDPSAYAGCGFRLGSASPIDLECVCSGDMLCPIGVANSCNDATQLLMAQDALIVCEQVSEGRCLPLVTGDATTSTGTTGTCTASCQDQCSGAPDCLELCGC
jgi:hypothetical protein